MIERFPLIEQLAARLCGLFDALLAPIENLSNAALYTSFAACGFVLVKLLEWASPNK